MTFSEKLAAAMRDKKISIRELSEKTGIPKSAIQRYTSGDTEKIPIDRMKLMAEALGVDPAYIMGWDEVTAPIRELFSPDSPAAQKLLAIGESLSARSSNDAALSELVDIYDSLNTDGRDVLLGTARGLAANPDMRKDGVSKIGMA